jgi:hypothetical protein
MIKWSAGNLTKILTGTRTLTILVVLLKEIRRKIAIFITGFRKSAMDPHVDPDPTPHPPFFSLKEK